MGASAGRLEIVDVAAHAASTPPRSTVEQELFVARDGVRVPLTIVRPRSLDRARAGADCCSTATAAGVSRSRRATRPEAACWLALGGVYAYANLRGGGEYGDAWRAAGQGVRKQTVFDDFQDAALRLIARGVTTPRLLGIRGLSNGGLLIAACYNQRPDLYAAAIAEIPLADVMWLDRTDKGRAVAAELGNPRSSLDVARALHAYSPLQNVLTVAAQAGARWSWSRRTTTRRRPARPIVWSPRPRPPPRPVSSCCCVPCRVAVTSAGRASAMLDALADEVAFLEAQLMPPAHP